MVVSGSWRSAARAAGLLDDEGRLAATVFAEMSALAARTGAINLGQGFPDEDGPSLVLEAAKSAIDAGINQYPPGRGNPDLVAAIAEHQSRFYGTQVDASQVLVTAGATEAISATLLALLSPGDEVITFEPYYDEYAAIIGLAHGIHVTVPLTHVEDLESAVSPRTKVIVVNSPNNPTGTVLDVAQLTHIVEVATRHDLVIVSDEVYEHLTFDGVAHTSIASLPGAFERTVTISSAAKTFSVTGWKVGWLVAPAPLVSAILTVKQYLTFVNAAPFQPAIAVGLKLPDAFYAGIAASLQAKRDILVDGLVAAGFGVSRPSGTYFVVANCAPLGFDDAVDFAARLPDLAGVVGVPLAAFVGVSRRHEYRSLMRFAFCKKAEVLTEASSRLAGLAA